MKSSLLTRDSLDSLYTLDPYMEEPATNAEKIRRMQQMLNAAMEFSLTGRQREIVGLYYMEEKAAAEIAEELGISRQSVHKTLRLAKKKLEKIKIFFKL